MFFKAFGIIAIMLVSSTQGQRLQPCDGGVYEIVDNSADNVITYNLSQDSVPFYYSFIDLSYLTADGNHLHLASCDGHPYIYYLFCYSSSRLASVFSLPEMTSGVVIELSINATGNSYNFSGNVYDRASFFGNGTIYCYDDFYSQRTNCTTDLVYPPQNTSCNTSWSTHTSPWEVLVTCDVTQVYSAMGRYSCQLIMSVNGTDQVPVGNVVAMDTLSIPGEDYVSGSCATTSRFPSSEGKYDFIMEVTPGRQTVQAAFSGSNEIRKPTSALLVHSCPSNVMAANDLDCTCVSSDLGKPAGSLRWNVSSASSRLLLRSVNRSDAGRVFSCQLLWNGTTVASIDYSFDVTYNQPSPPYHTCPAYVTEGSDLDCVCHTTNFGNPAGSVRWAETNSERLTRSNVKRDDAGKTYNCHLTWDGNVVSSLSYVLNVVPEGESAEQAHTKGLLTGLGVGIGLVVVSVLLAVLFLWRRGWVLPCSGAAKTPQTAIKDSELTDLNEQMTSQRSPTPGGHVAASSPNSVADCGESTNIYDGLEMSQVGVQSTYETWGAPSRKTESSVKNPAKKKKGVRAGKGHTNVAYEAKGDDTIYENTIKA